LFGLNHPSATSPAHRQRENPHQIRERGEGVMANGQKFEVLIFRRHGSQSGYNVFQ